MIRGVDHTPAMLSKMDKRLKLSKYQVPNAKLLILISLVQGLFGVKTVAYQGTPRHAQLQSNFTGF